MSSYFGYARTDNNRPLKEFSLVLCQPIVAQNSAVVPKTSLAIGLPIGAGLLTN